MIFVQYINFGTIICSYFLIGLFSVDNTYLAVCFLCLRYPWCAQTLFCYLYFFSSISELAHKRRLRLFTCYQMITILMSVSHSFLFLFSSTGSLIIDVVWDISFKSWNKLPCRGFEMCNHLVCCNVCSWWYARYCVLIVGDWFVVPKRQLEL